MTPDRLTDAQISESLKTLDGWQILDSKLHKAYKFKDFVAAFGFMSQIAILSEKINHHPEMFNAYNRVVIDLTTHDCDGISQKDFDLAQKIDQYHS